MLNKLLQEQVTNFFGSTEAIPDTLKNFLLTISGSYDHYEQDGNKISTDSTPDKKLQFKVDDYPKLSRIAEILSVESLKRTLAEKDKVRQETHLEASQRIAHIGSWELDLANIHDLNTNQLFWSAETYRIFGFEPYSVQVNNELFFSRVHPDDKELVEQAIAHTLKTGEPYDIEHRIIMGNGMEKVVHECSDILYDGNGNMLRMIGTIQDISERKRSREKLLKANYELNILFSNMQEVFFSVDMKKYQVLQISSACEEVYGVTTNEFIANPNVWFDVIIDEDKPLVMANDVLMRKGVPINNEYRIRHKNGEIRWLSTRITPTVTKDGLVRIDGITKDITKRKEVETALKNSEQKFRSLIENSSDAITVINEQYETLFASHTLYNITGFEPSEMIGKDSKDFVYPDDRPALHDHMALILSDPGKTHSLVYRRYKKDGTIIWCEARVTNLLQNPSVKGVVINFRDITERKKYEEALEISNEDLNKTNKELDKFVYSVSHDLRAPLTSMLGVIEIASQEITDDKAIPYMEMLKASIKKLDGFIFDILDYSRNARLEIQSECIHFDELLDDVLNNLKFMNAGNATKKVTIKTHLKNGIDFHSDKKRIQTILNNLVSNAMQYHDPQADEPYVDVDVKLSEKQAYIVIKDNGIGIKADQQQKVFDMFYRGTTASVGSGLGLYLVKETIDKLNGTIKLKSHPGKGTTFSITIPNQ